MKKDNFQKKINEDKTKQRDILVQVFSGRKILNGLRLYVNIIERNSNIFDIL